MRDKVQEKIEKRIRRKGRGKLYVNVDFTDLGTPDAIRQALQRLQKEGLIIRIIRGIYCYPKIDNELGLGVLKPGLWEIADAIARRDRIILIPTPDEALNALGLSTQVPANTVFYTNGSSRNVPVGKGKGKGITFIHTSDNRMLAFRSKLMRLIVLAMREIGEEHLTERQWQIIKGYVVKVNAADFDHDIKLTPVWIQQKMHSI